MAWLLNLWKSSLEFVSLVSVLEDSGKLMNFLDICGWHENLPCAGILEQRVSGLPVPKKLKGQFDIK